MAATKTITLADRRVNTAVIKIGNETDNKAERIKFVLPARLANAAVFLHMRIGDHGDVVQLDSERIFTPERKHTQYPGKWEAWLEAMDHGDVVWHSDTFSLVVGDLPDDGEQIPQEYPSAIEEALKAAAAITGLDARAETLPAGSEAMVRRELDEDGNPIIIFGIPRGRDGGGTEGGGGVDFEVDNNTLVMEDGVLRVNTTDKAEADNTQPITSAGVYTIIGNINAILKSI